MYVVAIIAGGGHGSRLRSRTPKQFLEVGGTSMLRRSIQAFESHPRIDEVIAVLPAEFVQDYQRILSSNTKPVRVVPGGPRRQDSVANGFARVPADTDLVVVHDAARPFVSHGVIDRTLDAAGETGAAIAGVAARDTVKLADSSGTHVVVDATLPRETIYLAQTPQAFRREVLREAIALGRHSEDATDEAMLAERAGHPVRLVDGDAANIKITTEADLTLARGLSADADRGMVTRVGIGYDLHQLVAGRPLILGGVRIPHDRGLLGHSDADAVCHAVVDAVLGAAAAGDIGRHFPDSDDRWKGVSSLDLLERARTIINDRGFFVRNIDVVVIAERPKLGAYLEDMRAHVARAAGVERDRVSIKGKTNEGVDAIGRGEAIGVQAVATVTTVIV